METELKYGQPVKVIGNTPQLGRYGHDYKTGQTIFFIWYIPFPSGPLPQFSDDLSKPVEKQTRQVLDIEQFEIL